MNQSIHILIGADLFPVENNITLFESGDIHSLFGQKLCQLLDSADYRIFNLEGCLTNAEKPVLKPGPSVRAPVTTVKGMKSLKLDLALLANTHAMDYDNEGLAEMCRTLTENGIQFVGVGMKESTVKTYHRVDLQNQRIIFYNVTEVFFNAPDQTHAGVNLYDEYRVCKELEKLKQSCDHLIVLYHGGVERFFYNTPNIRKRFHRMADSGADVVISQHTHAIGEEEYYNGSYLLYGQGNFCFNLSRTPSEYTSTGLLTELILSDQQRQIRNHLVRRTEMGCIYDEQQDLSDFQRRSRELQAMLNGDAEAGAIYDRAFSDYCDNFRFPKLFRVLRGKSTLDNLKFSRLSPEKLRHYMLSCYTEKQLAALLMMLTNEEFNEIAVTMIRNALREKTELPEH